jgi:hypothetical protein
VGRRILQTLPTWFHAGLAILLALGGSAYVLSQLDAARESNPPFHATVGAPQAKSEAAAVAESFAAAFNTLDYRNPDIWLESLRPLTTDREFKMLKALYVPMSWALFERDRRVVSKDEIIVLCEALQAQGSNWQVRLVEVTTSRGSQASGSASIRMHILLARVDGAWKAASLLSEEEAEQFLEAAQGGPQ